MTQHPVPPPAPVPAATVGGPSLYAQGPPPMGPPLPPGAPPGGVLYGPFPRPFRRYSLFAVFMLIITAALIFANAGLLLWPTFFLTWIAWFPWVVVLGNFSFILGVVLGLVILGAVFLYILGFRVLAAFMVFPTAIVSLFIGGGFVVGLVLGVLTGIYMIMRWHP